MTFGVRIIVFSAINTTTGLPVHTHLRAQSHFILASPPITSRTQADAHLQYPRAQHSGSEIGNGKLNDGLGCCLNWLCGNRSASADAPSVRPFTVTHLAEILCSFNLRFMLMSFFTLRTRVRYHCRAFRSAIYPHLGSSANRLICFRRGVLP